MFLNRLKSIKYLKLAYSTYIHLLLGFSLLLSGLLLNSLLPVAAYCVDAFSTPKARGQTK